MRLLTTKALYRAFPELDHFSDEQCRTFVAAAKRGIIPRLLRVTVQLLAAAAALLVVGWLTVTIANMLAPARRAQPEAIFIVVAVLAMFIIFGAAAVAYLITRDFLLRRRIRRVMRTRGSCYECGYGLTGLPVVIDSAADTLADSPLAPTPASVICPECGRTHKAYTAFDEVVSDAKGTLRYVPSPDAPADSHTDRVARLLSRLTKPALYLASAAVMAAILTAGVYEYFLRQQAATARADLLTQAQLDAALSALYPDLPAIDQASGPIPFERADAIGAAMERAFLAAFPNETGNARRLDFDVVLPFDTTAFKTIYDTPTLERTTLVHGKLLESLIANGLDRDLETLAAMAPVRPTAVLHPAGSRSYPTFGPSVGPFSPLLSASRARMRLAIQNDDLNSFIRALTTHLGLLDHIAPIPHGIASSTARYEHSLAIDIAVRALHRHRSREWLDAIEKALANPPPFASNPDMEFIHNLFARHSIAETFADPSNVRFGTRSSHFSDLARSYNKLRVGTYAGSIEEFNALRALRAPSLTQGPFQRLPFNPPQIRSVAAFFSGSGASWWLDSVDGNAAHFRALKIHLALERFLLDQGSLPSTLQELVPVYLNAVPIDPYSGDPLLYKVQPDPAPPGSYVIYSVGCDQHDHGGDFGSTSSPSPTSPCSSPDLPLITMPPQAPSRN